MTQEVDFQHLLIQYLLYSHGVYAKLPLSLSVLVQELAVQERCSFDAQCTARLKLACLNLAALFPASFKFNELAEVIEHFNPTVLELWERSSSQAPDDATPKPEKSILHDSTSSKDVSKELLELISDNRSFLKEQSRELESLISAPTSQFFLSRERALAVPEKPFTEVCSHANGNRDCLSKGRLDCLKKIHFQPIITGSTDTSIGDCSYLDTCYKGKGCKYVHYQIMYPENPSRRHQQQQPLPSFYSAGERMSGNAYSKMPPQWISCDIRKLDFNVLGQFSVIIADPPWDIHMNGHLQIPYGVITDEEILSFKIDCIQTEGIFFLWVTGRALDVGRQCLRKWGYNRIEEIVWCKTNQLGRTICTGRTGHWLNHSKEHVLVGVKGSPAWLNRNLDIDTIVSATRDKSHKPDELYEIAERLAGPAARKLELFGREHNIREQWLTVGNQLDGTRLVESDVAERFHKWRLYSGQQ